MGTKEIFSVLIPDGESPQALGVLQCLAQIKNIKTYILSNNPWAPIRFSRYSTRFYSYPDKNSNERQLAAIFDMLRKKKVDVVLPVDTKTIGLLSANPCALSKSVSMVPLPQADAFEIAANKWLLAGWLKQNKIPHPSTILYQPNNSFDEALSSLSFPVLIKPAIGSSGEDIEIFYDAAALYSFCKKNINSREFIVQSFINGYDIDCSALCQEGKILAYTIQKTFINGPHRFGVPSGIEFLYDTDTYNVVKELIEKFNWSGIVHIDLRYDEEEKQVKVIEMNPRYWGSLLGSLCAGVNFPYLACLTALKLDLPKTAFQPKRFVKGKLAINIIGKRLFYRNKRDLHFDNSVLEFLVRDPLPRVIQSYSKIYKKIVHKR
ncbi:MAG TPA: ATP-grasp domain-containing protein [Chitinophagaceae bacterium]|nr:ATP-grasp domain-containing protein [Chitinophagaceae bacterium]